MLVSGQKSYTACGNMHAPSNVQCLKWVKECWITLSPDIIMNSCHSCETSVNVNSIEVAQIHCHKAGEATTSAAPAITDGKLKLLKRMKAMKKTQLPVWTKRMRKTWQKWTSYWYWLWLKLCVGFAECSIFLQFLCSWNCVLLNQLHFKQWMGLFCTKLYVTIKHL